MSFSAAFQLWWLAPLGGAIVALYLLRMRRRDQRVSATFLWPQRTEEVRANALIQRLRFNWLMVLQLIALALLVGALARPVSVQRGLTSAVTVFVVDVGASMAATDVAPSRLSVALKEVREAIASSRPQDRIAIIEAGPTPKVLSSLSSDKPRLTTALSSAVQTDAPPAMSEALRLAAALTANESGARIVVVSDGVFPKVADFAPGRANVIYRRVGVSDANVAITAFGVSDGASGKSLFCSVENEGKAPQNATVSIYGDGSLVDSRALVLPSNASQGFTIRVSPTVHVFEAKLSADDYLKSDNYAVAVADAGSHVRTLLVAPGGDPFVEKALALDPRVTLDKTSSLPDTERAGSAGVSNYDLIVFDGAQEVAVKAVSTLTFGKPGPASPVTLTGEAKHPAFTVAEDVPLMAGLQLASTFIESASLVMPKAGATVVATGRAVSGAETPLIVQSRNARRQIYVSFRPGDSDLPLQFGFPILISNAIDFLAGVEAGGNVVVPTGAPISMPATGIAKLVDPAGNSRTLAPVGGSLVLRGLDQVGRYRLEVDGKSTTLYATLRDRTSSHIEPVDELSLGAGNLVSSTRPVRTWDLWRYGILTALLVLAGEWALFARRS